MGLIDTFNVQSACLPPAKIGTLRLLAHQPESHLVVIDLLPLRPKLPESSPPLNGLRPLLAKNEREVRDNMVKWVKNIRQASNLDANIEKRLIIVISQLNLHKEPV
jgi:hypothetical protein